MSGEAMADVARGMETHARLSARRVPLSEAFLARLYAWAGEEHADPRARRHALGALLASLPFLSLWLDYPTVTKNSNATFWYSFGNLPFFVLPIVAYLGSSRRGARCISRPAAGVSRSRARAIPICWIFRSGG
jgi:hypothetical protein